MKHSRFKFWMTFHISDLQNEAELKRLLFSLASFFWSKDRKKLVNTRTIVIQMLPVFTQAPSFCSQLELQMFCWYYFFLQALLLFLSTMQHITLPFHKALVLPPATPISKHKLDIPGRTHSAVWLFASCYCKHVQDLLQPCPQVPYIACLVLEKVLKYNHNSQVYYPPFQATTRIPKQKNRK